MKRYIRFRAREIETGALVYGYVANLPLKGWVLFDANTGTEHNIDQNTIEQNTEFLTARGVAIYEGDQVRVRVDADYLGEYHDNEAGSIIGTVIYTPAYGYIVGWPQFKKKGSARLKSTNMRCRLLKGRTEIINPIEGDKYRWKEQDNTRTNEEY